MRLPKLNIVTKLAVGAMLMPLFFACERQQCDEEPPTLTFDSLYVNRSADSLVFECAFVDCQGDIGHIGAIDSLTPRSVRTYLFERIDGDWIRWYPPNLSDTVAFFAVIPGSAKNKEDWLLKGTIRQTFGLANLKQNSDTIRFETHIFDNAGHRSETVRTPAYVLPN